jgi:hypothetical protein
LKLPAEPSAVTERKNLIRQRALNCHWSSLLREPDIEMRSGGLFDVTVYALDRDHGPEIEAAVRSAFYKDKEN